MLPKIYVMDRGWVLVGVPQEVPAKREIVVLIDGKKVSGEIVVLIDGKPLAIPEDCKDLDHCHVIRKWGTSQGIGELAIKGPLKETVLDYEGDGVKIYRNFIHHEIPCSAKGWIKWGS